MKKKLEVRITKIVKLNSVYKLFCDVYDVGGMRYDTFEYEGFVYLENIESFHPEKSIKILERKENITYEC